MSTARTPIAPPVGLAIRPYRGEEDVADFLESRLDVAVDDYAPRHALGLTRRSRPRNRRALPCYALAARSPAARGLRIAWSADLGLCPVDREIRRVAETAVRRFEALTPGRRKEHLRALVSTKRPETRARRIADIADTGFLDGTLVIPQFVLRELQMVADSGDSMKRNRGRRGLDVLSKLQNSPAVDVRMHETDPDSRGVSVDQRLVTLAKQLGARIITNDFNLNKVASVQGVDVINLNDVANSLKPRYIPGERLRIRVLKEGEAPGQGVGYLDDGTMVVIEQGRPLIGQEVQIVVTSVLQTPAGRMIFGRPDQRLSGSHTPYPGGPGASTPPAATAPGDSKMGGPPVDPKGGPEPTKGDGKK